MTEGADITVTAAYRSTMERLETEYHQGQRANFSSADLTGRDFSGLNLRGMKMDRAVLRGADCTGADLRSAGQRVGVMYA